MLLPSLKRATAVIVGASLVVLSISPPVGAREGQRPSRKINAARRGAPPSRKARRAGELLKLIKRLRAEGAVVERVDEDASQPFFSAKGSALLVNGEPVQAFEYKTAAAAAAEARRVSPTGTTIGTSKPAWFAPPHFYRCGKLIVLYVGNSAPVKSLLEKALGPQFAGQ